MTICFEDFSEEVFSTLGGSVRNLNGKIVAMFDYWNMYMYRIEDVVLIKINLSEASIVNLSDLYRKLFPALLAANRVYGVSIAIFKSSERVSKELYKAAHMLTDKTAIGAIYYPADGSGCSLSIDLCMPAIDSGMSLGKDIWVSRCSA